ncbi:LysE family translocator [Caulobacter mirabilis]|uniref:Lysine transporter LysE n=1 Tax=Caulobacter mirabilis TaxID=69666 RepID=A0A2D2B3B2_9CAUL|nr:LysE family translocator [Caulobacter mirabilis]ATQ44696.1 lysine transporter LysE [Caulobacter mirabilis]
MSLAVNPTYYLPFLGAMAMMAISPGPANTFAVATGMQRGHRQALLAVAGMNTASLLWFAAAALGLGALMTAYPKVFHWLSMAGAVYVAWLGLKSVWSAIRPEPEPAKDEAAPAPKGGRAAFIDGFSVQLTNPKVLVFFAGVLIPMLDPKLPIPGQLPIYAATTITMDVLAMGAYGLGGAALSARMSEPRFRRGFSFVIGALLIGVAVMILLRG